MNDSNSLKEKGNAAFATKDYKKAITYFTDAIQVDSSNHVLWSNRSACYASLGDFTMAKTDAEECVRLKSDWPKGYIRLGAAYHGLKDFDMAISTYEKGLKIDPSNETLRASLDTVKSDKNNGSPMQNPFAQMFGPDCWGKIASNPQLQPYLSQPDYVQMIQNIVKDPNSMNNYIQDQRMMQTFMALSGINMPTGPTPSQPAKPTETKPAKQDKPPTKSEAQLVKEKGNGHYKKKEFNAAIECYEKALELEPTNTVYLLNLTAVYFEQERYDFCIERCDYALTHCEENKAGYQTYVKLVTRKASCLQRKGEYKQAIELFKQALLEWRNPDTLGKLQACEKELKQKEAEAYYNEDLSKEHKDKGNAFFKVQKYPEAVEQYTEAIKRWPKEHTTYSNRAACYLKLCALDDAIKDCDTCLSIMPTFVRAYYRKGNAYLMRKQYNLAMQTFEEGLKIDPQNTDCLEGKQRTAYKMQEMATGQTNQEDQDETAKRAMADPEIQAIMQDSYMQLVLSNMQKDPAKIQEYMADPTIANKINKLVTSGILRVGNAPPAGRH